MKAGWLLAAIVIGIVLIAPLGFSIENGYNRVIILSKLFIKFLDPVTMPGVTVEGNLNSTGNTTIDGYYGGMFNFTEGGFSMFNVSTFGIYYNATGLVVGLTNGMDFSANSAANGGDTLIIRQGGVYHITAAVSLAGGSNGLYGIAVAQNYNNPELSEKVSKCYSRFIGTGKTETVVITCFRRLNAGDRITLILDDEANPASDPKVEQANVNLHRIGN